MLLNRLSLQSKLGIPMIQRSRKFTRPHATARHQETHPTASPHGSKAWHEQMHTDKAQTGGHTENETTPDDSILISGSLD